MAQDLSANVAFLRAGVALPIGNFSDTEESGAGHALPGFNVGLDYQVALNDRVLFSVYPGWNSFGLDDNTFDFAPGFTPIPDKADLERSRYQQFYLMTGPAYSLPLSQLTVTFVVRSGLVMNQRAETDIRFVHNGQGASAKIESKDDLSMGIMPGIIFQLEYESKLDLMVGIDYFYSKPEFQTTTSTSTGSQNLVAKTDSRQAMNSVLISWGLSFPL